MQLLVNIRSGLLIACLGGLSMTAPVARVLATTDAAGAAFLEIPAGAEAVAVGSAYTAAADNALAPAWNPGGMAWAGGLQIAAQHAFYLESMAYDFISGVVPLGQDQAMGISAQLLSSGTIAGLDEFANPTGDFSGHYEAIGVGYARKLMGLLSVGVNLKVVRAQIVDVSASSWAVDVGCLAKVAKDLRAGLTIVNLGAPLKFIAASDRLPWSVHLGAAWRPHPAWSVFAEGVYAYDATVNGRVGGEWRPLDFLSLRAGLRTDALNGLTAGAAVTAGVGVRVAGQELAYAWVPYGDLGSAHYLSLTVDVSPEQPAR